MITTKQRIFPEVSPAPSMAETSTVGEKLRVGANQFKDALGHSISRYPVIAIGSALTVGVLLGWLIKRR